MRIAFVTSTLEPGRDGVGDYARGLAEELSIQGHPTALIALHDSFITEPNRSSETGNAITTPTLRLPQDMPWEQRTAISREFLNDFGADWTSLQFVSYGFSKKGIVRGLGRWLRPLFAGTRTHFMFHETWLCREMGWDWKRQIVGAAQLFYIKRLLGELRPSVINTSNHAYRELLGRAGISAPVLKLFGNMPIIDAKAPHWIEGRLRQAFGESYQRQASWVFGFFGALHPQWPPEPLMTRLMRAADSSGKRPVLLSIGRMGYGAKIWADMTRNYSPRCLLLDLGEQPAERISEYLSHIDCGIATTPRATLGKSGTAIAMFEHGLPVIVNRDDLTMFDKESIHDEAQAIFCGESLEAYLASRLVKWPRGSRRPRVAEALAQSFEVASTDSEEAARETGPPARIFRTI